MQGICFKPELFDKVINKQKTQTRRKSHSPMIDVVRKLQTKWVVLLESGSTDIIRPKYGLFEKVFLKEPYAICSDNKIHYKFDNNPADANVAWKNKLFMPAEYARFTITICDVFLQKLGNITEAGAKAEGFSSVAEFQQAWEAINGRFNPDEIVWGYDFRLF